MTEHGRQIDDPTADRIRDLEQQVASLRLKCAEDNSYHAERLADMEAALSRAATYLGVAHLLKDPKV